MNKKIFVLSLLVMFAIALNVYAADSARRGSFNADINGVYGVADVSTGWVAEVDSNGSLQTQVGQSTVVTNFDGMSGSVAPGTARVLYTGACKIQGISIGGDAAAANDSVNVYDAITTPAGTVAAKFEVSVGTAKDTEYIDCHGASFSTGIWVDSNTNTGFVSITYNAV